MKKCLLFIVTIAAAIIAMIVPASAASYAEDSQIEQVVTDYLDGYLREAYLYEEENFSVYTVSAQLKSRGNELLTVNGESVTVREAAKNIAYMEDKADYFKAVRQAQGIRRSDFSVAYIFNSKDISADHACVDVSAMMSFRYDDHSDMSMLEERFTVALVKLNGSWLVADTLEKDGWFDAMYKNDATFDADAQIQEYLASLALEAEAEKALQQEAADGQAPESAAPLAAATAPTYDPNNAVAYAYTYTTSVAGNVPEDFYNENFQYFSGDCMNFVSQCIWAGFGGNNNIGAIDGHKVPMDVTGAYVSEWFSSSRENKNNHSATWTECGSFKNYLERNASDTGLRGKIHYLTGSQSFASVPNWSTCLLGSALHVPGQGGDYGHAVIVTSVSGSARNQVEYCGHTNMAKAVKVGDTWPNAKIRVMTNFTTDQTMPSPKITVKMIKPIPVNSRASISAQTDVACYSLTVTTTSPGGKTNSWTVYDGKTSITGTPQLYEKGLYTIKISAVVKNGDAPVEYYYTIRTY